MSNVSLRCLDGTYGLVADRMFVPNEPILVFEGLVVPTEIADIKRSIEISDHFSLEWTKQQPIQNYLRGSEEDNLPNVYLNFSTGVPVMTAMRTIRKEEELIINYRKIDYRIKT